MIRPEQLRKKKLNTGGNIGEGAGAIAGNFIPGLPPGVGSMVGAKAGRFLGNLIGGKSKPKQPAVTTGTTMGYKYGGKYKRHLKYNVGGALPSAAQPIGNDAVKYSGPKHEEGGIPIDDQGNPTDEENATAEVEGDETRQGDYIFSDELMVPDSDMTFAEAHEMLLEQGAGEEEIEQLAQMQEQVREQEGVADEGMEQPPGSPMGEQGFANIPMAKGGDIPKYAGGGKHHTPKGSEKTVAQRTTNAVKGGVKKTGKQARSLARGVGSFFNPKNVTDKFRSTPLSVPTTSGGVPQGQGLNLRPKYIETSKTGAKEAGGLKNYRREGVADEVLRKRPGSQVATKLQGAKALKFIGGRAIPAVGAAVTAYEVGSAANDAYQAHQRYGEAKSQRKSAERKRDRIKEKYGHYSDEEYFEKYGKKRNGGKLKKYNFGGFNDQHNVRQKRRGENMIMSNKPTVDPVNVLGTQSIVSPTLQNNSMEGESGGSTDWSSMAQRFLPSVTKLASAALMPDPKKTPKVQARTIDERNPAFAAGRATQASGFRANPTQAGHAQYTQGINQLAANEAQDRTRREQFNAQSEMRADQMNVQSTARDNEMKAQATAARVGLVDQAINQPIEQMAADKRGRQQQIANIITSTNQVPVEDRERTLVTNLRAFDPDMTDEEIQRILSAYQMKYGGKIKKK